ncbi:MAG: DinB family protein [Vicinamibacteraceae bacterium]
MGFRGIPRQEEAVANIDAALAASRDATERLIADAETMAARWATPRSPGKWSPSQIVEHVARSYDGSVQMSAGLPSAFPRLPGVIHPLLRIVFRWLLRKGSFPKGRTTKAMNPLAGPTTPAEGRARLAAAHERFEAACRDLAARGALMRTTMFGAVPVEDFVRFMELHTRHHDRQIGAPN